MIGFIIGTAAILGACIYARSHHHHRYASHCGRQRRYGWDGGDRGRHGRRWDAGGRGGRGRYRSRGPRRWIAELADRLDASPEQERVIHDVAWELFRDLRSLGDEAKSTRSDLGAAFGTERLDEERMGELFARHDELLERARKVFVGALARVHDALDPQQREQLSRLMGRRAGFGPYRV